jgi:predicted GNAT family acetyltransferase
MLGLSGLGLTNARVLEQRDLPALRRLLDADPVGNCAVAARVDVHGVDRVGLGGEIWGYGGSELTAACYSGANLVPVGDAPAALRSFADRARRLGRRCSSIVGPARAVRALWERLEPNWGPARAIRPVQPLMIIDAAPRTAADPHVRAVRPDELDRLMPASIAMFTEELGISPVARDGGTAYRARVADAVSHGCVFAKFVDGKVVFKAELGAVSARVSQVQGVWVDPAWRGQGLGTAGVAAVVQRALAEFTPVVSLYVNDFNHPARAAYRRVGFREVGTFMSVMF